MFGDLIRACWVSERTKVIDDVLLVRPNRRWDCRGLITCGTPISSIIDNKALVMAASTQKKRASAIGQMAHRRALPRMSCHRGRGGGSVGISRPYQ